MAEDTPSTPSTPRTPAPFGDQGAPDFGQLLAQAQKVQAQLEEARTTAEAQEVEGQAGGGVVKVTVTGGMEFRKVTIDPSAVDPEDVSMLEDLVLAALRDAVSRASKVSEQAMGSIDLGLGGGLLG